MPFYRDGLFVIGVDGVITAFAKDDETVFLEILNKVAPFDGH